MDVQPYICTLCYDECIQKVLISFDVNNQEYCCGHTVCATCWEKLEDVSEEHSAEADQTVDTALQCPFCRRTVLFYINLTLEQSIVL